MDSENLWWGPSLPWPGPYLIIGAASIGVAWCAFKVFVALSSVFDYDIFDRRRGDPHDFDFIYTKYKDKDIPLYPEGMHLPCSHWATIGGRQYMEDRFSFKGKLQGRKNWSFVGVYDGHGGALAAEFAREKLHLHLQARSDLETSPKTALMHAFRQTDDELIQSLEGSNRVDGTTAVVALISGSKLYVANAGDSRALLVKRGARCLPLSRDHKPNDPDEMQRIQALGGKILFWGRWRVEGVLAVSRALGDKHLKPYVSAEPEVMEYELSNDEEDYFLVLATDGIWDVLSNETVAQMVMNSSHDIKLIARQMCEEAWLNGSMDNMTAVVIDVRNHHIAAAESPTKRPSTQEGNGEAVLRTVGYVN